MDRYSTFLLYILVGFCIFVVTLFFLSLGPLGIFILVFSVLIVLAVRSPGNTDDIPIRTNCSKCGAPNKPDRDRCKHCQTPLETPPQE